MDIQTLTSFFVWCTIMNGALLILCAIIYCAAPDWVYRAQSRFFPIPKEIFPVVFYSCMGVFKILFIIFNLVPCVALLIIG